jgi:hypothetical protein
MSLRQDRAKKKKAEKAKVRLVNDRLRARGINLIRDFENTTPTTANFYSSDCGTVKFFRSQVELLATG